MSPARRAAVVAAAAALVGGVGIAPAVGEAVARAVQGQQATGATWGAAAGPEGGPAMRSDYVIQFSQGAPIPAQYFDVFNTGTVDLTGQTYRANNVRPTNGNAPPTVTLEACIGARFDKATGLCAAGRQLTLTSTDQAAGTAVSLPLRVGELVNIRAAPSRLANYPQPFNTVVTITVGRGQAAPARTRTS